MKRRKFIACTVLGAAGVVAQLANPLSGWTFTPPVKPAATNRKQLMLNELTIDDFSPHLGGNFKLHTETIPGLELELIEATPLGCKGPRPAHLAQREPFSLIFRAPKPATLPQQIYQLQHDQLGTLEIFLVPIGCDAEGSRCEAVFN